MTRSAVILAAGRGSRMGALTDGVPKPLLLVKSKPLIQYVVELLAHHGVGRIGVNLHYKGDEIRRFLGDGSRWGVRIEYVEERELSGTAGGVKAVAEALSFSEPFFAVSSDMLVNFDLSALYAFHLEHGGLGTLSCYWRPADQLKKSGVVLFDQATRRIQQFVERPQSSEQVISQWVNSSVYVFSPGILKFVGRSPCDFGRDVFPEVMRSGQSLYAHPFPAEKFYQLGIDTPERISRAEGDIDRGSFVPCGASRSPSEFQR